jgi:ParB-like chromosome segregation protein Spo0J
MNQIISMPIEEVKPYDKNPRKNDSAVEATANSIKEFGWQQPIVVDKNHVIIVGHTRLKAAKELKMDKVPVVVADNLTDEQVKTYRLADNKTGELADWDFDLLNSEILDIDNFNLEDFGFKESELNIEDGWDVDGDIDDYEEPKEEEPAKCKCPECGYVGEEGEFKA